MGAPEAKPVTVEQILTAKNALELAAKRLEDVLTTMTSKPLPTVTIQSHNVLTHGVMAVLKMSNECRSRAEDESISPQMGVKTKLQVSRDHHAKYSKKSTKKTTPNK